MFVAAREREDSISSTYDTFVPNQINGLQQLIELQQRVKAGSLTVDGALERVSNLQRDQKGMDALQQVRLSHAVIALTLDFNKHAGPNPNKTITICCSCYAKLQHNVLTVEHENTRSINLRVKKMAINTSSDPNVWRVIVMKPTYHCFSCMCYFPRTRRENVIAGVGGIISSFRLTVK